MCVCALGRQCVGKVCVCALGRQCVGKVCVCVPWVGNV